MRLKRIHGVGILVDDLDTMVDFLVGLGLTLSADLTLEGEWLASITRTVDPEVNIVALDFPGLPAVSVMLFKYSRPAELLPPHHLLDGLRTGLRLLGLVVDDLQAGLARAVELGAIPIGKGTVVLGDYEIAYILGPEQLLIMMAEELPFGYSPDDGD